MFLKNLFDFLRDNIFWLSAILIIIVSNWIVFFEIRKLKKYINDNNISEILHLQKMILNIQGSKDNESDNTKTKKEEKEYTDEEIGRVVLDMSIENIRTNDKLDNWRNFGIFIILLIIYFFIKDYFLNH